MNLYCIISLYFCSFKSNGEDLTFQNCDGNGNAYFAFYSNPKDLPGRNDVEDGAASLMGE